MHKDDPLKAVELLAPDEQYNVASGSGYEHLYKILRSLALLQPTPLSGGDERTEEKGAGRKKGLLARLRRPDASGKEAEARPAAAKPRANPGWQLLDKVPLLANERRFKVLITSAAKGTIPANVWRSAHVVFMEDL